MTNSMIDQCKRIRMAGSRLGSIVIIKGGKFWQEGRQKWVSEYPDATEYSSEAEAKKSQGVKEGGKAIANYGEDNEKAL